MVTVLGILIAAPTAIGQDAAVDQYVPKLEPAATGGSSSPTAQVASDPGSDRDAGGGSLPFTGFPLTSFVLAVGGLLLGALAVRTLSLVAGRSSGSIRNS